MSKLNSDILCFVNCLKIIKEVLSLDIWFKDANDKYLIDKGYSHEHVEISKAVPIDKNSSIIANGHSCAGDNINFGPSKMHIEKTEQGSYEIYETNITDATDNFLGIIGFSKDITQEILLSKFLGFAYRSIDDDEFSMTFLSEGCHVLTGYRSEELLNKQPAYYDLIDPEYRKKLLDRWVNDLKPDEIGSEEYPITTATGESRWVWEQFQERKDPNHVYIATEGFVTDITERKLAEKALAKSEERFRTMFEKAPLGIGIFHTPTGKAIQVNKKFAEILKRTPEEILSISWTEYTHSDDVKANWTNLELLKNEGSNEFSMTKRYICGDGSLIWVNMTIAPFSAEDTNHHLCMIEDITDRKEAEEEILFLSYHDTLTELYNRRYYELALHRIDNLSNLPISLVLADVNGLKLVNDVFGHLAGDKLLKKVAKVFKEETRENDIASRIGGDEFILILPKTGPEKARKIVDRINSSISNERIECITCSVSFGLATKTDADESIDNIFMRAENRMYNEKLLERSNMRSKTIRMITKALYEKSKQEQLHCERVSKLCESMGLALNMSHAEIDELKASGLLHDIGKIGIDLQLLNKETPLTEEEWSEIMKHSEIGYQILKSVGEFSTIAYYVLYHHERIDGRGYPKGIGGDKIPIQSRIIAIANAYDHMTYYYRHQEKKNKKEAAEEILKRAGTQFDKELSEIFIKKVLKV